MFGAPFILVIDDEEAVGEVMRALLSEAGYPVLVTGDPVEGLFMASRYCVNLIILDMLMPILNGAEFLRQYRETCGSQVPVIATSVAKGAAQNALRLGANSFMPKPFNVDNLLERVQSYVYAHPHRRISWS